MRLICPQCNALYDVPGEMIPPEGREVECSACGNIWYQPANMRAMRGLAGDLRGDPAPMPAAGPQDLGAIPVLQRPLPEDVLSILREETARELAARRAARGAAESPADTRSEARAQVDSPTPTPKVEAAAPPEPATPPAIPVPPEAAPTVDAPDLAEAPATEPPPAPEDAVDWPATTLTAPDDSQPRVVDRTAPIVVASARDSVRASSAATAQDPKPIPARDLEAGGPDAPAAPASGAPAPLPAPTQPPAPTRRPAAKVLPDAERLAATLLTQAPAREPVLSEVAAPLPSRYGAGFRGALLVTAAALALYVGASGWVRGGAAPAPVVTVVGSIDQARAGLQDAAMALLGKETD